MKDLRKQQGFTVIEAVIVIAVVAILAVGGWFIYDRNKDKDNGTSKTTTSTEVASDKEISDEVPEVKNASDLKTLDTQLNDANLGDTNVSDLNSQLDF